MNLLYTVNYVCMFCYCSYCKIFRASIFVVLGMRACFCQHDPHPFTDVSGPFAPLHSHLAIVSIQALSCFGGASFSSALVLSRC